MHHNTKDDLAGRRFGKLTAIRLAGVHGNSSGALWETVCDCGGQKRVARANLLQGNISSCGCASTNLKDLTGKVFGYLTVIGRSQKKRKKRKSPKVYWTCLCSLCNKTKDIAGNNLTSGKTMTCGCRRGVLCGDNFRTHGRRNMLDYSSWSGMRHRCNNPNNAQFKDYGGRGIKVCARWMESYENFYADMGERPLGMSLDRIDNDGDYEPGNCRWATMAEQQQNRTRKSSGKVVSLLLGFIRRMQEERMVGEYGLSGC